MCERNSAAPFVSLIPVLSLSLFHFLDEVITNAAIIPSDDEDESDDDDDDSTEGSADNQLSF